MGKKKGNQEYNDFLDGEKLQDNSEIRTTLSSATSQHPTQASASTQNQPISPPQRHAHQNQGKSGVQQKKPQLTHFLCLPLINESTRPGLEVSLSRFADGIEEHGRFEGLFSKRAIRPVGTLHLTLGVMSVPEHLLPALEVFLEGVDLRSLLPSPAEVEAGNDEPRGELKVDLEGLVPMHKSSSTSILYAEPKDADGRLRHFATGVRDVFMKGGWCVPDDRELKLHATIVNTVYAKPRGRAGGRGGGKGEGHGPNARNQMKFDARDVIAEYEGFKWAEGVEIDRVQICRMGAKKVFEGEEVVDERYEVVFEKMIAG